MGKISDAMQNVVDEIYSSAEARGNALRERSEQTKQLLKDSYTTRQAQAKALKKKLSSDEKAMLEAGRQFMSEIGMKVGEMRSDTHNLLERFHLEHRDMTKALKEKLSSENRAIKDEIHRFMDEIYKSNEEFRKSVRKMLDEIASDLRQAHQIWREGAKKK